MKVHTKVRNARRAEYLLTEDEVRKLINHARTMGEKAFIATLYESGCKIGELVFLTINQTTNKFSSRCGIPLDEGTKAEVIRKTIERKEADDIMDSLLEDQEFRELFMRKLFDIEAMSSVKAVK